MSYTVNYGAPLVVEIVLTLLWGFLISLGNINNVDDILSIIVNSLLIECSQQRI